MKVLCILAFVLAVAYADSWQNWKRDNQIRYRDSREDDFRQRIFVQNRDYIRSNRNRFRLRLNANAARTAEEIRRSFHDIKRPLRPTTTTTTVAPDLGQSATTTTTTTTTTLPTPPPTTESLDWRTSGAVTAVKNQGDGCSSGWAFAAAGAAEGLYKIKYGTLRDFSEQQFVDCSTTEDAGCDGGNVDSAYRYMIQATGLSVESDYPYRGVAAACSANPATFVARLTTYNVITPNSDAALIAALRNGPVAVQMDTSAASFALWGQGIYSETNCYTTMPTNWLLLIGFGVDSTSGQQYYLVKSSMGTAWGEQGYIRVLRNSATNVNICGILSNPVQPVVA